jgi:hypothetical protein
MEANTMELKYCEKKYNNNKKYTQTQRERVTDSTIETHTYLCICNKHGQFLFLLFSSLFNPMGWSMLEKTALGV